MKPWMLKPDRLALAPPEEVAEGYTFEKVGPEVRADGRHESHGDLQRPGTRARPGHADGVSSPKEKIVVEADLFNAAGAERASCRRWSHRPARTFYNNVQRLKLDVTTIAPIHGGRTYPWADFARFVGTAATN